MPKLKIRNLLTALLALLWLTTVLPAQSDQNADERILSFDSNIALSADGAMQVRETIDVFAAGEQIKHGIYRDFPTRYSDFLGNRYSVGFEIISVQRDGNPEPYHTESLSNGVRVYFGDKETFLTHGIHRYVFTYTTNRQLGFFDDHDELYWNVTGDGWVFPIEVATATVVLPPQIHNFVTSLDGFTGAQGERGKRFTAQRDEEGNPHFRAEGLPPRNGLTIIVTWPKGLIPEPTRAQKIKWFLSDNRAAAIGLAGLLIVLCYYLVVWSKVGRDPAAGPIVPLYEPPDNMSPAAMRYLKRMHFDDATFTSAILGLAAKKHLTIDQDNSGTYRLIQKTSQGAAALSSEERNLQQKLFQNQKTISLSSADSPAVRRAQKALSTDLNTGMEKTYFVTNSRYVWPGIALTIVSCLAIVLATGGQSGGGQMAVAIFMAVWLSFWSIGVGVLLHAVVRAWKSARASKIVGGASAMGITLFSIPFVIGEVVGMGMLAWAISAIAMLMVLLLIGSNVLFHHLLKAPTRAGRQLLDRVDGFKMFLTAVDGQRMNTMMPPFKTPELFERFLPYALALGVEHAWAEQFSQVLATAGAPGHEAGGYSPSWYSGGFIASSPAAFASSFSSGFSGAVSAASSPPGSSSGGSGGGGGGGSGGGGGGGGGGGW